MNNFNKEMTIKQVLTANPKTADVFMSFGMHCLGCPAATAETLEEAGAVHGLDIDELVKKLNAVEA